MSEQVYIGNLLDPQTIKSAKRGKTYAPLVDEWDHRAMWSYLRLQYKRKTIDQRIKDHFDMIKTMKGNGKLTKAERRREMKLLFADLVKAQGKPRKMQFILIGGRVMAVASLKHLLIPPSEVYEMANRILSSNYSKLQPITINELSGLTFQVKEMSGMKLGLQVFGGSITTREAITLTSWLRVELCLNPLSWLGVSSFGSLGLGELGFERILRIKVRKELEPRLRQGIKLSLSKIGAIEGRIATAEKVMVKRKDAKILMAAMGISYSLGAKTIRQVLDRYAKEPKNQWGLSMANSWVASHGNFKKTPDSQERVVEQKLSTLAGATLLIDDIATAKNRSLAWLKSHVKEGRVKAIDELIGDLI